MPLFPSRKPKPRTVQVGGRRFISQGLSHRFWDDIYHQALTIRWPVFFALAGAAFIVLNGFFAVLYLLGDHAIANQFPPGFAGAFFFSVETLATVGYGDMHPQTLYAHLVATVEIFTGMGCIALMTGLIFSRFSRPRAKILFASNPIIRHIDGHLTLMIRAANARQNVIASATAKMHLLRRYHSPEGFQLRKIYDLKLVRELQPIFWLSWSLMHIIDESSPLYGHTPESLAEIDATILISIEGIDETTSQSIHARHEWRHDDLRWNHRYVDLVTSREKDVFTIDYGVFNEIELLEEAQALPEPPPRPPDAG